MQSGEIHIGTSGWHYAHWKGPFYPEAMPSRQFLKFYISYFQTVEMNNPFYRLPNESALRLWRESVPDHFVFSVKASRLITHIKRLKEPKQALTNFLERIDILNGKLGPILFQLPPRWNVNIDRLREFLKILPPGYRYTFEFRDPSWYQNEVYAALRESRAAFCIYHLEGHLSPEVVTTDFMYLRLHGPGGKYQGSYSSEALSGWAKKFVAWAQKGMQVYCYFDNDQAGYAAIDALRIKEILGQKRSSAAA